METAACDQHWEEVRRIDEKRKMEEAKKAEERRKT
jgi:hypothetical protein